MAVTFEQARKAVRAKYEPRWNNDGTYWVAESGFETATHWIIKQGAKECLVDGDPRYALIDDTLTLVEKETGLIVQVAAMVLFDTGAIMTPVSG